MEMMVFRCHRIFVAILNGWLLQCVLCMCATFEFHATIRSFVVVVSSFFDSTLFKFGIINTNGFHGCGGGRWDDASTHTKHFYSIQTFAFRIAEK